MMMRENLVRFRRMVIGLATMSGGEQRVTRGSRGILGFEIAFRFAMMIRGFLIVMRGVVMMARCRMPTRHARYFRHGAARRRNPESIRARRCDRICRSRPRSAHRASGR